MKKGLKLFTLAFALMFAIVVKVSAGEVYNVDSENSLKECLEVTGNTCRLDADINITSTINITEGKSLTIDLFGFKLTGATTLSEIFKIENGSLRVMNELDTEGTGGIFATNDAFWVQGNSNPTITTPTKSELKIEAAVNVVSENSNCIYIRGKGAKADVYGSLTSNSKEFSVIQGNGTVKTDVNHGGTEINIYEPAKIISTYAGTTNLGIYHPQSGTLNIYGGTIKGVTGIEMRAGNLNIKGGTIIGTAETTQSVSNGDGPSVKGAGVAIAQHTTIQEITATISGGNIEGATALYESTPENPSDAKIVNLEVTGGIFMASNDGDLVFSANKTNFIKGGEFKGSVDEKFVSENLETKVIDGVTYIGESIPKAENNEIIPNTGDNVVTFVIFGLISLIAAGFVANKLRKNA